MIILRGNSLLGLIKQAYLAVDEAPLSADPDIYREDAAVLALGAGYIDPELVESANGILRCVFDGDTYFPNHNSLKVVAEDEYWNQKLIQERFLVNVTAQILNTPLSRSCLYSFWDNNDFEAANPKGNCITQVYFRLRGDELEMHSHIRANDVHRCLFMDLAYLLYAHQWVAQHAGYKKGAYVHFVDSLHIYNKSVAEFKQQLLYMRTPAGPWE